MKIIAAGTGSAFCMNNYHTNFVICHKGKRLLVDCGTDIRFALRDINIPITDIDAAYISHAHADHAGGLEALGFITYFTPGKDRPKLYGQGQLLTDLWVHTLKGGMEGLEGKAVGMDDFFEVCPVQLNSDFVWQGICFEIVQTVHISAKYKILNTFGLMFNDPKTNKRIYITTDTQFSPEPHMMACYKEADVIIHDCETAPYNSGVHAAYVKLRTLPDDIKKKMYLCHYQDNILDEKGRITKEWKDKAKTDKFAGFISKGQELTF